MAETLRTAYVSVAGYVTASHDSAVTEATEPDHFFLSFRQVYVTRNFCFRQRNHMITLSENYGKPVKNAQKKARFFQVANDLNGGQI